jgi:hypothetical protein
LESVPCLTELSFPQKSGHRLNRAGLPRKSLTQFG